MDGRGFITGLRLERLKKFICLIIIYLFHFFPIKKNKLFLFNYYGGQYGCNPKYITNYINKHYPNKTFDVVWAFNDLEGKNHLGSFRKVKTMSFKYFYELCTAKVVITNYRTTNLFVKRKNQYYIQTWHSSLRLKQIEKDAEDTLPPTYVEMAKEDSRKCDLLLSGCKYSTHIFKESFWYDGEIFEHGTPRNDVLFQDNIENSEVFEKLKIPSGYNVLLYAPTFRDSGNLGVYDLDYEQLTEKLEDKFDGKWIILVRLHPHLISRSSELVFGNNVIDATSYDDIQELMLLTDILISDYSSLVFDFSITSRPCFLYVPDLDDYMSQDRKLYFDVQELPFISATSNSDLLTKIDRFDNKTYQENVTNFLQHIGSYEEGKASEHLLNRIHDVCFGKEGNETYEAI